MACKLQLCGQMILSKTFKLLLSEEAETYLQDSDIVWRGDITFGIIHFMDFFFPYAQMGEYYYYYFVFNMKTIN